jgi:hypothetical protein
MKFITWSRTCSCSEGPVSAIVVGLGVGEGEDVELLDFQFGFITIKTAYPPTTRIMAKTIIPRNTIQRGMFSTHNKTEFD